MTYIIFLNNKVHSQTTV